MQKTYFSRSKNSDNNFSNINSLIFQKLFQSDMLEDDSLIFKKEFVNDPEECLENQGEREEILKDYEAQEDIIFNSSENLGNIHKNNPKINHEIINDQDINLSSNNKRTKATVKEFKCTIDGCKKTYKSKENLKLHIQNIHENKKPYKCRFCSAVFSHRNGKTYHERKYHINYLPYQCNYIGMLFL